MLGKCQMCHKGMRYIVSFTPCISQFKLIYAAVTNNSKMLMAYKTKVYFLTTGYAGIVEALFHILEAGLGLYK